MTKNKEFLTSFKATSYPSGKKNGASQVIVIPKSRFDANLLEKGKEYEFFVKEVKQ